MEHSYRKFARLAQKPDVDPQTLAYVQAELRKPYMVQARSQAEQEALQAQEALSEAEQLKETMLANAATRLDAYKARCASEELELRMIHKRGMAEALAEYRAAVSAAWAVRKAAKKRADKLSLE